MAYDSTRHVTVVFGGRVGGAGTYTNETWEWDGEAWTLRTPAHAPSPRGHGGMCFDSVRGVCVYFGGTDSAVPPINYIGETWEWDGDDWALASSSGTPAPMPRHHTHMAFSTATSRAVLFGGRSATGVMGDTWEYDGTSWTQLNGPGPAAREAGAMCSAETLGVIALFAGSYGSVINANLLSDTWTYDATGWHQVAVTGSPLGRSDAIMVFDAAANRFTMFGGFAGTYPGSNETWHFDGVDWTQSTPSLAPEPRSTSQASFHAEGGYLLLFGGYSQTSYSNGYPLGDTWRLEGSTWRLELAYTVSPLNGHRYALGPPMSWQDAEALAQVEGGHLATVRSDAENTWLVQTFSPLWIPGSSMWIGLNDAATEGQFVWSSGENTPYRAWSPNQPDNSGNEDYVHYLGNGLWNDLCPNNCQPHFGLIELPPAQPASYSAFGAGCPGPQGAVPSLFAPSGEAPVIGASSVLRIANMPLSVTVPVLIFGFSTEFANGPGGVYPLPLELGILGWPGCYQLVSLDDLAYTITASGSVDHTITLPPYPFLAGMQFHAQALVLYTGGAAAVTNAITATAGW